MLKIILKHTTLWLLFLAALGLVIIVLVSVIKAVSQYRSGSVPETTRTLTAAELTARAQEQQANRDWAGAEQSIQEAIKKDTNLDLHGQLAVVKYWLKKYGESIAEYETLIAAKKEPAFAENGIGNAYRDWAGSDDALKDPQIQKDRQSKAIAAYERSIALDPTYVAAYSNLALLYKERGEQENAKKTLEAGYEKTKRVELQDLLTHM